MGIVRNATTFVKCADMSVLHGFSEMLKNC